MIQNCSESFRKIRILIPATPLTPNHLFKNDTIVTILKIFIKKSGT